MKKIYSIFFALIFLANLNQLKAQVTSGWTFIVSGTSTTLLGVAVPSENICYVSGISGIIRKSIDGGAT